MTKLVKKNHSAKDSKIYLPFYCQISSELSSESSIMEQKFREIAILLMYDGWKNIVTNYIGNFLNQKPTS